MPGPPPITVDLDLPEELQFVSAPPGARQLRDAVHKVQLKRLAMRGLNAKQAAQVLGIGVETAKRHYRDPLFRREVLTSVNGVFEDTDVSFAEKKKSLIERIGEAAEKSFDVLIEMLDSPETSDSLRARVAQDFLDRNPDTQSGQVVRHGSIGDPEALAVAARAAREVDAAMTNKVTPIRKTGT